MAENAVAAGSWRNTWWPRTRAGSWWLFAFLSTAATSSFWAIWSKVDGLYPLPSNPGWDFALPLAAAGGQSLLAGVALARALWSSGSG